MTLISRDPYAREELHSKRVYINEYKSCAFCGTQLTEKRTGKKYLYLYRVETDGGRTHEDTYHLFCSNSCRKAWYA